MTKFAANLSMLFTEYPFLDRFEQAHKAGFKAIEYLFPYDYPAEQLADILRKYQLEQVLFNAYPGDWDAGEKGFASLPGKEKAFEASIIQALDYAKALSCKKVHVMSGIMDANYSYEKHQNTLIRNLRFAADIAKEKGVTLTLEPLNSQDVPSYFISHQTDAVELIKKIDRDNVKLQFDFYHAQIMDGNLTTLIEAVSQYIGHVQIASVPYRHEPNSGEIYYPFLLKKLSDSGYQDWIGCEYIPEQETLSGLIWLQDY